MASEERLIIRKRLGDLLIERGKLTPDQLQTALTRQRETGGRVGQTLIEMGYVTEGELFAILAGQLGLPQVDLGQAPSDPDALLLIPPALARKYTALPIRFEGKRLVVALADPLDYEAIQDLGFCSGAQINAVLAGRRALVDAIEARYKSIDTERQEEAVEELVEASSAQLSEIRVELVPEISVTPEEAQSIADRSRLAPIIRLANLILSKAVKLRASDVHIEPEKRDVRVRYRVDGLLREDMRLPKWVQGALISRIKVLAKLDIAERRLPQDGAVRVLVDQQEMDLRVSVVPLHRGEKVVIRVLNQSQASLALEDFRMSPHNDTVISSLLAHRKGLILVTGPTGSGKTTTLFAMIKRLAKSSLNIATVEDPVEYQLEGINQMQVNAETGLTFAACLRAVLRQDPDVILIGEIRDPETAQIAVRAAMTGHLVLSTVHTNDAPSTLSRLVDLGVPRFLVASQVVGIIAQRLVRLLCSRCKQPGPAGDEDVLALQIPPAAAGSFSVCRPAGCAACQQSGYVGRTGLYELMPMTTKLRELVTHGCADHELQQEALAAGMVTLFQDGLAKIRDGATSIDELVRVVEVEAAHETVCATCEGVLHADFITCPTCGTPAAHRCRQCGNTLRPGWAFCPRCRRKDDPPTPVALAPLPGRRERRAAND